MKSLIKLVIPHPIAESQRIVRWMAARRFRALLHFGYALLPQQQKARAHALFSTLFRNYDGHFKDGKWKIDFCNRSVIIPLRCESAWIDWDMSLSLLGHDSDLTRFCGHLLHRARPRLVLDVGASYGQFSIRWLVHGVRTISFEPNPRCHSYFRMLCHTNGVRYELVPVALGSSEGTARLWFAPAEEWLGTTSGQRHQFDEQIQVAQRTLDGFVEEHNLKPDLLKIDAEASDLVILHGSSRTLAKHRPLVLFESLNAGERSEFHRFLEQREYAVCGVRLVNGQPKSLNIEQFGTSVDLNFLGCPLELLKAWPPQF